MPKRILTSIYLPHDPRRVWTVLTDFDRYRDWNPLNVEASGEARVWAKVAMRFLNLASPGATLRRAVTNLVNVDGNFRIIGKGCVG